MFPNCFHNSIKCQILKREEQSIAFPFSSRKEESWVSWGHLEESDNIGQMIWLIHTFIFCSVWMTTANLCHCFISYNFYNIIFLLYSNEYLGYSSEYLCILRRLKANSRPKGRNYYQIPWTNIRITRIWNITK